MRVESAPPESALPPKPDIRDEPPKAHQLRIVRIDRTGSRVLLYENEGNPGDEPQGLGIRLDLMAV